MKEIKNDEHMEEAITEWLGSRKATHGVMLVFVLYWGFRGVIKALRTQGMRP